MAITAKSILHRAVDILQDQTSVRWPMAELVRYFNDAQRIVAKARPDAMNTAEVMNLEAQPRQSLNAAGSGLTKTASKLIEVTRNMAGDGAAVTKVQRPMMDAGNRDWYTAAGSMSIKHFMFDERDPTAFYVYPQAMLGAKLEVMFSAYPKDINEPDNGVTWSGIPDSAVMSLPEIYADDVLNMVLAMAWSKDSEYAGNEARAQSYRALVTASLGAEIAATVGVAPKPAMK